MSRENTRLDVFRALRARPAPPIIRVGISIEEDRVLAVAAQSRLWRQVPRLLLDRHLRLPEDGQWPDLYAALTELRNAFPDRRVLADITLHRPACHLKRVALPPLRRAALRQLVSTNARRLFASTDSLVVDGKPDSRTGLRGNTAWIAAVNSDLTEVIVSEGQSSGIHIRSITPGPFTYAAGLSALGTCPRSGQSAIVLVSAQRVELVTLSGRRVTGVRSTPLWSMPDAAGALDQRSANAPQAAEVTERLLKESFSADGACAGKLSLIPIGVSCEWLCQRLLAAPAAALTDVIELPPWVDGSPSLIAALGALHTSDDEVSLLPSSMRHSRQRALRRRISLQLSCAAILAATALGIHHQRLNTELDEVRHSRTVIRPAVEEARQARAALDQLRSRLAFLDQRGQRTIQWTAVVAAVASALPDDSYLRSLRSEGGSLHVGGRSPAALEVLAALENAGWAPQSSGPLIGNAANEAGVEEFEFTVTSALARSPGLAQRLEVLDTALRIRAAIPEGLQSAAGAK